MRGITMREIVERITVVMTLVVGIVMPCRAQSETTTASGDSFAYVTNQVSNNVSVINTSTNTVVATIPLPGCDGTCPVPAGLAVTPDGTRVYVANSGNGTVSVIATATNTVAKTISITSFCDCTSSPIGVAITPDGTRAYVTDPGQPAVDVIDTNPSDSETYNTVVATITTFDDTSIANPWAIAISPDGIAAFVTEFSPNSEEETSTVYRIDTNPVSETYNTVTNTIQVGNNPTGVAVTPNSAFLYVTNNADNTVSVIPNPSFSPITTVQVGSGPYSVAITPNGQFAYVVNQTAATVSVINTATYAVTTPIDLSCLETPYQIAITPDGSEAYVADTVCGADIITTATNTVTQVSVGSGPFGVATGPVTTAPQPIFPGAIITFTDDNIINQTVAIPPDAGMNNVVYMQMSFIQVSPAVFNSTRLTGTPGNAWSGGNQGPFSSPPTTCTPITGANGNCIVMEAKCLDMNQVLLPICNIHAPTTLITLTSHYETPGPQPTPAIFIADDGQNDWANITIAYFPDPTLKGGTRNCQMDTFIGNLGGPVTPTPPSVNFGNVPRGGFPIRIVTLTNTGTAALNITSANLVSIPGQDSDDFLFLSLCQKPLLPTKSCIIFVSFFADADDFSQQSATLNITNNAPGSPLLIVPLSATVVKRQ
jgi:YVTN family beta-propeller protein